MAKKDFSSDLQNFVKKIEKEPITDAVEKAQPKGVGRPREHEPYEKTTVTFPPELMGKLKVMCLYEGKQIREILEECLGRYVSEYEQQHGNIRIPPRFRSSK